MFANIDHKLHENRHPLNLKQSYFALLLKVDAAKEWMKVIYFYSFIAFLEYIFFIIWVHSALCYQFIG